MRSSSNHDMLSGDKGGNPSTRHSSAISHTLVKVFFRLICFDKRLIPWKWVSLLPLIKQGSSCSFISGWFCSLEPQTTWMFDGSSSVQDKLDICCITRPIYSVRRAQVWWQMGPLLSISCGKKLHMHLHVLRRSEASSVFWLAVYLSRKLFPKKLLLV